MVTFWERAAPSVDNIVLIVFFFLLFVILVISRFGLEGEIRVLIAPDPGYCILVTSGVNKLLRHQFLCTQKFW